MVRVKICGIRREEDARAAAEAGADLLGFNFWRRGPRYVEPSVAAQTIAALARVRVDQDILIVGVFVDESPGQVLETAQKTGVRALQFHGSESPEYWNRFESFSRIKAFKVAPGFDPSGMARYRGAAAYLLDAAVSGMHGGTGQRFDWSLAEKAKAYGNVLLAGGLTVENVGEAVRRVRPWGVDVASGVETAPGIKDHRRIREFIRAVREAEKSIAEDERAAHAAVESNLSKTRL